MGWGVSVSVWKFSCSFLKYPTGTGQPLLSLTTSRQPDQSIRKGKGEITQNGKNYGQLRMEASFFINRRGMRRGHREGPAETNALGTVTPQLRRAKNEPFL